MKKTLKILGITFLIIIGGIFFLAPFISNEIVNAFEVLERGLEKSTIETKINYQKQYYQILKTDKIKTESELVESIKTIDKNLKQIDSKISNTIHFIEDSIIAIYSADEQEHTTKYLVGSFSFDKCSGEIISIASLLQQQEDFIHALNDELSKNSFNPYIISKDDTSKTITKPSCELFNYMPAISAVTMLKKHRLDQYEIVLNQLAFIEKQYQ